MIRLVLIGLPLIEIVLFVQIGGVIGVWATLAVVLLSAIGGMMLLRRGGLSAFRQVEAALQDGRDPGEGIFRGAMLLLAAALLIIPGFFSDALGLLLLIPAIRNAIYRALVRRWAGLRGVAEGAHGVIKDRVIEGEYVDLTQGGDSGNKSPPSGWTQH